MPSKTVKLHSNSGIRPTPKEVLKWIEANMSEGVYEAIYFDKKLGNLNSRDAQVEVHFDPYHSVLNIQYP